MVCAPAGVHHPVMCSQCHTRPGGQCSAKENTLARKFYGGAQIYTYKTAGYTGRYSDPYRSPLNTVKYPAGASKSGVKCLLSFCGLWPADSLSKRNTPTTRTSPRPTTAITAARLHTKFYTAVVWDSGAGVLSEAHRSGGGLLVVEFAIFLSPLCHQHGAREQQRG